MSHFSREYMREHMPDGEELAAVIVKLGMPYAEMVVSYHNQIRHSNFEWYVINTYPEEAKQIVSAAPYLLN